MQIFAKKLKELRKESGYSQQKMAELLQIKQQSYARYELDTSEPCYEMLVIIAKLFDVSADYLLGLED